MIEDQPPFLSNQGLRRECVKCHAYLRKYILEQFENREEKYTLELENLDTKLETSMTITQSRLSAGTDRMNNLNKDIRDLHKKVEQGWKDNKFPWIPLLSIFFPIIIIIAGAVIMMFSDIKVLETQCENYREKLLIFNKTIRELSTQTKINSDYIILSKDRFEELKNNLNKIEQSK